MTQVEKDRIRREIAEIDREIVELVARRTSLAERIGGIKVSEGLPLKDAAVEAKVIARYRSYAEEYGLDPDDAGELADLLIGMAMRRETQRYSL